MSRLKYFFLFSAASVVVSMWTATSSVGQATNPKLEFRGAWIATVINLDWPSRNNLSTSQQQQELTKIMNDLSDAGINAVFFQIRSESDAFYESEIEPWSRHLTGSQGIAPSPFYDPLEFAVQLAHDRGMELHVWINPFRVRRDVNDATNPDSKHVSRTHPEWILTLPPTIAEKATIKILDPGIPDARAYVIDVIDDVMRRYDIDGVHFDDYFYPYPPNEVGLADVPTYNMYGAGFGNIVEWRIDNIDQFVQSVADQIRVTKPDLKFGISPFGIWKSGVPEGIVGLSAVDVIFADAPAWMANESIDYLVPQLYWAFGGLQDFAKLAPWWASVSNGRHIYPGLAAFKSDPALYPNVITPYSANEVPDQILFSRGVNGIDGQVFFRAENLGPGRSQGLSDVLRQDLYSTKAITPPFFWRDDIFDPPGAPQNLNGVFLTGKSGGAFGLTWDPSFEGTVARKFGVYRVRSATEPDPREITNDPANLIAISYAPFYQGEPPIHPDPYYYVVTGITANSIEGDESSLFRLEWTGLGTELPVESLFRITSVYPNPVSTTATVEYELNRPGPISLSVYDALGREIKVLVNGAYRSIGTHTETVDFSSLGRALSSGVYFVVLQSNAGRISKPVMVLR